MAAKIALPTIASLPANASARARILTAGVEVLHTEGFAALTQQAVAEKAGVRQSHITYYFPTRLDLLQATAQFGVDCMLNPISSAAMKGDLSFADFRELLLPDLTDRSWWRLMIALVNACSESERIRAWIVEFDEQLLARMRGGFAAFGIELDKADSQFLHAAYIGALTLDMQEQTDASQTRAREIVGMAIDFLEQRANTAQNKMRKLTATKPTTKARSVASKAPPPRPKLGKATTPALRAGSQRQRPKKK
jgi:AcrR family transcriptional regulator